MNNSNSEQVIELEAAEIVEQIKTAELSLQDLDWVGGGTIGQLF